MHYRRTQPAGDKDSYTPALIHFGVYALVLLIVWLSVV